jgi:ubiquinone/menaquinone biosynthesis C-methylase UbiE
VRVLDLGCGPGRDLHAWQVTASDRVTGLDIDGPSLSIAKVRFSDRTHIQAAGEHMPFADQTFDRVISSVALPYMNIQKTLAEIHRILVPDGRLSLSMHPASFTISELVHNAIPKPIPTLFRLYVIANGLVFHSTGRVVGFLRGRTESFQTERGVRIALLRAQFVDFSFRHGRGPFGKTFAVEARKANTSTHLSTSAA